MIILGFLLQHLSAECKLCDSEVISFNVNYKESVSDLCIIGKKYDTDKSSQRVYLTPTRHCHPYTLFYHSLFKDKKNSDLVIAELGILKGASLLMWREYFPNARLYGFEFDENLIQSFQKKFSNDRIVLAPLNVHEESCIAQAFHTMGVLYDLIIEDTTHQFEDQIRVVENIYPYLKPGGMLIIEDIFKSYKEQDYLDRLEPILNQFQDYYFISMDHKNRNSAGWDNDKLFVLVKGGADPIFKNKKKLTIITPSMRPLNLLKLKDSIDFDYVDEWIIVYDGSKIAENPYQFKHENNKKIKEYLSTGVGISGNPQRNFAVEHIQNEDTYLYYVDDDNLVHKDLYKLLQIIDDGKIYTFDQKNRFKGDAITLGQIDTAMFLIDFKLCKNIRWKLGEYGADYYYIQECYEKNKNKWIYVNNELCTYNIITQ
jgi:predicted O-methyltransferase YrrM